MFSSTPPGDLAQLVRLEQTDDDVAARGTLAQPVARDLARPALRCVGFEVLQLDELREPAPHRRVRYSKRLANLAARDRAITLATQATVASRMTAALAGAGWAGQSSCFPVCSIPEVRNRPREHDGAEYLRLVAPQEECPFCCGRLAICETQERYVRTLDKLIHLVGKGKKCVRPGCGHSALRYRSPEVGRLVLKAHEFGRDVVIFSGDQYIREKVSIPRIHKRLVGEFGVPISERSVGNQVDDYVALCECVAGDTGRLRERLRRQGGIVLCVDGVHFDEASPVLYVQRDALSNEVLYAERRLARGKEDLVPMLRRSADLAAEIGVSILGIVSDKERGLVPAIAEVFAGIPHQYCQTHFLSNVVAPLKEDDQALARGARETVLALRKVQRSIERSFPEVAAGGEANPVAKSEMAESERTAADTALAEAKVAAALARAGTTAGVVFGRPITDPPGYKRVDRLQRVRAAVKQAARKRGLQRTAGH